MVFHDYTFESPIGNVKLLASKEGVSAISFVESPVSLGEISEAIRPAYMELQEYFSGTRTRFDFPIVLDGTDFQISVWQALLDVPFGKTESYQSLSIRLGNLKAIRAVASANGANPLAIVVPCHRIIGSDGSLTGYAGGLWRKQWLLEHEGILNKNQVSLF